MMLIGIFGTGRNGSTLLLRLLDGIEGIYTHPIECNFLLGFNDLAKYGKFLPSTRFYATTKKLKFLNKSVEFELLKKWYLSPHLEELHKSYFTQLKISPSNTFNFPYKDTYLVAEFVPTFLNSFSKYIYERLEFKGFMFKTIETPYIQDYKRLFPDMKFIHIIRNPIDVFESAKRTKIFVKQRTYAYLGGDLLLTMILKRWIPHAHFICSNKFLQNHFVVKYEDLIKSPLHTIKSICRWLKLPLPKYPDKLTVFGEIPTKLPPNVSKKNVDTPKTVVNTREVFNYESIVEEIEKLCILYLTYDYGKKLGYYKDVSWDPEKKLPIWNLIKPRKIEFINVRNIRDVIECIKGFFYRRYWYFKLYFKERI